MSKGTWMSWESNSREQAVTRIQEIQDVIEFVDGRMASKPGAVAERLLEATRRGLVNEINQVAIDMVCAKHDEAPDEQS